MKLKALKSDTLRGIVDNVNELNVKREDIVYFTKENGIHILLYYGKD